MTMLPRIAALDRARAAVLMSWKEAGIHPIAAGDIDPRESAAAVEIVMVSAADVTAAERNQVLPP